MNPYFVYLAGLVVMYGLGYWHRAYLVKLDRARHQRALAALAQYRNDDEAAHLDSLRCAARRSVPSSPLAPLVKDAAAATFV